MKQRTLVLFLLLVAVIEAAIQFGKDRKTFITAVVAGLVLLAMHTFSLSSVEMAGPASGAAVCKRCCKREVAAGAMWCSPCSRLADKIVGVAVLIALVAVGVVLLMRVR